MSCQDSIQVFVKRHCIVREQSVQKTPQNRQVVYHLPSPVADSMPYWVQVPSHDDVETSMQGTVQGPVIQLQPSICFFQFTHANLDTL